MKIGFAAFFGSNIRHKFDHSLSASPPAILAGEARPSQEQAPGAWGLGTPWQLTCKDCQRQNINGGFELSILHMKVRMRVVVEKHPNEDAVEGAAVGIHKQ